MSPDRDTFGTSCIPLLSVTNVLSSHLIFATSLPREALGWRVA